MKVVLMRGCPGAGKSTYVAQNFPNAHVVSTDFYHTDSAGNYNWKPQNILKSVKWCQAQFQKACQAKKPLIVVDNTNTLLRHMKPYVFTGRLYGYTFEAIRIDTPVDVAAGRNIHGVPYNGVKSMSERMQNLPVTWNIPEKIV